jgi:hypothetical protein
MNKHFYLLKIKLLDIEPAIWRRFVVPANITLDRLHDVIQIVMGWNDKHLHLFTIGKKLYTEFPEVKEDGLECGKYRLSDLVKQQGRTFQYRYDFGDDWDHEITLEDKQYIHKDSRNTIFCLDGSRACPPEDVGGVPGYIDFSKSINFMNHRNHQKMKTWSGGDFDPEKFNTASVNLELLNYLRWSRDRFLPWEIS